MPRKKRVLKKRETPADSKYNSVLVSKLINCVMIQGRKSTAEKLVYESMDMLAKQGKDALVVTKTAVENIKPLLELKSRRIGGANYQIPIEVNPERRLSLAMRWLVNSARDRKEKGFAERLANELVAASTNQGGAIKKREDIHKMADANKAFAHYRW